MPQYDSLLQNLPYPVLTDKPNAQQAFQALVEAVAGKVNMVFASASVRGAAIATPVAGMVTYIKDTGLIEYFDGDQWATLAAGTTLWTSFALASDWGHNGNDNGTFQYRLVNLFGENTIMLRGAIERATPYPPEAEEPGHYVLNTVPLPTEARPASLRTINVACSDVNSDRISLKIDIRPDGFIRLYGAHHNAHPPWVSFNGTFCSL